MFRNLLISGSLIFITLFASADDRQKINSKVQKVTVFLNGAQVTRTANVTIAAGVSVLVFGNLSPYINEQSLQVNAGGDFTILSVKSETSYANQQPKQKNVQDLEAQQQVIQTKLSFQNTLLGIDKQEEQTLISNQITTDQNTVFDITRLQQALDFQTARLTAIKKREIADSEQINLYNEEIQRITAQIAELTKDYNKVTTDVMVTVSSKTIQQALFTLSYVINGPRWFASYDIRAKNVNSPITIVYKANISQQSGEDWKNVKLNLSTGSPNVNDIKPDLSPYYLNFFEKLEEDKSSSQLSEVVVNSAAKARLNGKDFAGGDVAMAVQQIENQTNVEFSIDDPFTIPGDGKQYIVKINQVELPAKYQYYVAPKIRTEVFLTANITDWNKYNFLPGEANIFFEGTYTGKSAINARSVTDTLNLSLGTDKNIVVTRTSQKDLSEKQFIGSNKKETRNWLIDIKNRKSQPVTLLVEDQVPVSQNSAIEVENQELTGGNLDKTTGKVAWAFTINPNGEKKLQLKYQVRYPKNQSVIVQ